MGNALGHALHRDGAPTARPGWRLAGGLLLACGAGLTAAALYGVTFAFYFATPMTRPLRWALWPCVPVIVAVLLLAIVLAVRRSATAPHGWDTLLAFPASAILLTATGMALRVSGFYYRGPIYRDVAWRYETAAAIGGLLLGIGVACMLARRWWLRTAYAVPLGLLCLLIAGTVPANSIYTVTITTVITAWWLYRV
ncbi:hypothetical protein [Actinoplanes sp. NPDC051494]|uniref:hypothetical protein n=1 Tax=Actinoplanes sp. NPDC051494 TaxID=3363907 RepID=UPI0037AC0977